MVVYDVEILFVDICEFFFFEYMFIVIEDYMCIIYMW